eukprot:GILI01028484.1.p1 GENE.GILI01028484.1~~GILI01028484.1.p1  ORF type:complete len:296 (-),score=62.64 GILI01028484.1:200-1087(-)
MDILEGAYALAYRYISILCKITPVEDKEETIPPRNYPPQWTPPVSVLGGFVLLFFSFFSILFFHRLPIIAMMCLMFWGHIFVAGFVLKRSNPLKSRYRNYNELYKLWFSAPFIYFLCSRSVYSLVSSSWAATFTLLLSYLVGLHFTYFDNSTTLQALGCKFPIPSQWHTITGQEFTALLACLTVTLSIVTYHAYLIVKAGLAFAYLLGYAAGVLLFVLTSLRLAHSHYTHMHHYFLFGVLLPLTNFPHLFSVACQGLFFGVFVEGIAVWGMDPLFEHKSKPKPVAASHNGQRKDQ